MIRGVPHIDIVGRFRTWLLLSGALLLITVIALSTRGLNLSIEFEGGTAFRVEGVTGDITAEQLSDAVEAAGATDVTSQLQLEGGQAAGALIRTEAIEPGSERSTAIQQAIADTTGVEPSDVQTTFVGPTWGSRVSAKALQALVVFLVVIVIYISLRLEFKMAIAALVSLLHDLAITAGLYALVGFQVSPSTVIAFLTILGYSLYDTVIVFDRIKETEPKLGEPGRRSYAQLANTAMNEVFFRSLSTSVTATLPVASLLFVGSQLLGATTLADLALALLIGMVLGAYSSLFIAGPTLAWWRMREPEHARRAVKAEQHAEDDEALLTSPDPVSGPPITTEYVRGEGRRRRRER